MHEFSNQEKHDTIRGIELEISVWFAISVCSLGNVAKQVNEIELASDVEEHFVFYHRLLYLQGDRKSVV